MKKYIALLLLFAIACSSAQTGNQTESRKNLSIQDIHWSPDGNRILFSALIGKSDWSDYKPENWGLYELQLRTKNIVKIDDGAMYGVYGPGRREIAYSSSINGNWEIVVLNITTGARSVLTENSGSNQAPSFSPDGSQIVFMSERDGVNELYTMNHDGTNQQRLTNSNGGKAYNPEWSPDGKSILYYVENGDHQDQVYVIDLSSRTSVNVTNDNLDNMFPGWGNDGSIVYSGSKGNGEPTLVFRVNADGSEKKAVANLQSFFARYSPDGLKIAFISKSDNGATITITNSDGLSPQQFVEKTLFMQTFAENLQ